MKALKRRQPSRGGYRFARSQDAEKLIDSPAQELCARYPCQSTGAIDLKTSAVIERGGDALQTIGEVRDLVGAEYGFDGLVDTFERLFDPFQSRTAVAAQT